MTAIGNFLRNLVGVESTEKTTSTKTTTTSKSSAKQQGSSIMSGVQSKDEDRKLVGSYNDLSLSEVDKVGKSAKTTTYTIKAGDTLSKLAASMPGVTVQMLMDANPGIKPTKLQIGQKINIPVAQTQAKASVKVEDSTVIANAKQKALAAKEAFQKAPSGTKNELELQKTFIKEYTNWAKTVLSSSKATKAEVEDVIAQISGLKTYKSSDIKPLQAELNALLPALREKIGTGTKQTKTQITTPAAKTEPAKTTTPAAKKDTAKTTTPAAATTQTEAKAATAKTHKVVAGDTYWKIANANGISVEELKAANPGVDPAKLRVGQTLKVPAPKPAVIHSNMAVDASKRSEYKSQIQKMMKAKGITDKATLEKLSTLITDKSIEMKVDPIVISGIIGQECDYLYQSDNIWGRNGKGITQLTYSAIEDLYRLKGENNNYVPSYYKGPAKDKLVEIFQKYPDVDSLYKAICKKENYELNLEVGIIVFKGKIEIDYSTHPERTERQHLEHSIRNYNGNVQVLKSGKQVRDQYRDNIVANYDSYKVS